jgi:hypothetical protein
MRAYAFSLRLGWTPNIDMEERYCFLESNAMEHPGAARGRRSNHQATTRISPAMWDVLRVPREEALVTVWHGIPVLVPPRDDAG